MSAASVVPAGHGEVIGDAPDRRVEVLCEHDAVHVTWTRFGPGRNGASPHIHRHHTDLFYVLEGELTVRLGRDVEVAEIAVHEVSLEPGAAAPPRSRVGGGGLDAFYVLDGELALTAGEREV